MKKILVGLGYVLSLVAAVLAPTLIVRAIFHQNIYDTVNHFGTAGHILVDCLSTVMLVSDPMNPWGAKRLLVYGLIIFIGPGVVMGYHKLAQKLQG